VDDPDWTWAHRNSNVTGSAANHIEDRRTPGTDTIATLRWLVDDNSMDSVDGCIRGL